MPVWIRSSSAWRSVRGPESIGRNPGSGSVRNRAIFSLDLREGRYRRSTGRKIRPGGRDLGLGGEHRGEQAIGPRRPGGSSISTWRRVGTGQGSSGVRPPWRPTDGRARSSGSSAGAISSIGADPSVGSGWAGWATRRSWSVRRSTTGGSRPKISPDSGRADRRSTAVGPVDDPGLAFLVVDVIDERVDVGEVAGGSDLERASRRPPDWPTGVSMEHRVRGVL